MWKFQYYQCVLHLVVLAWGEGDNLNHIMKQWNLLSKNVLKTTKLTSWFTNDVWILHVTSYNPNNYNISCILHFRLRFYDLLKVICVAWKTLIFLIIIVGWFGSESFSPPLANYTSWKYESSLTAEIGGWYHHNTSPIYIGLKHIICD